jgi:undecaprenyl-diphosphatase
MTEHAWRGRTRKFVAARLDRTSYLGLHLTLGLLAIALVIWAFGALLDEILEQRGLVRWDTDVALRVHLAATPAGTRVAQLVSNVGSPTSMAVAAALGVVALWRRHRLLAVTWLAAVAGGLVIDALLKLAVRRVRPPYGTAYLHIDSFSFPSGHAMGATIGAGMLAYVLHQLLPGRARGVLLFLAAALVVVLVGGSRIYLGVHYPTDVAGGIVGGVAWIAVCLTGAGVARGRAADRATPTA